MDGTSAGSWKRRTHVAALSSALAALSGGVLWAASSGVVATSALGVFERVAGHPAHVIEHARAARALETYADIAWTSYADAADAWRVVARAADELLAAPSVQTLAAARHAWLQARIPYLQTEVYRFYGGPIDQIELLVNTWPIDESFIESPAHERLGIIDDVSRFPALSRELLLRLNGDEGETSISTGYHAVEFLLWGRDTAEDGPGDRPFADFAADSGQRLIERRREYLSLASQLLAQHLDTLRDAWRPDVPDNARATFLALPPSEALRRILKGMGGLSGPELAGERLTVPYETRDPENEQSCFSDSTHQDITYDAIGIENVCLGRYKRRDGSWLKGLGLCELLRPLPHGAALAAQITASVAAARALPNPFDSALAAADGDPRRQAIARTIQALEAQTATIAALAAELAHVGQP
ncbi:MAG: imelysin family protein [Polyangiales bacterium]